MIRTLVLTMLADFGHLMTAAAAAYALIALAATLLAKRGNGPGPKNSPTAAPGISVLKPLCGDEPRLLENLRTFCRQDYRPFQVLFGVQSAHDPAIGVVKQLQAEFPDLDLRLVVDPAIHGINGKVSNLANLLPSAAHPLLVIADSDIAVEPDYLARVTAPLRDPGVGVVTCLYRGRPVAGAWSAIGRAFIDDWFVPIVRVGRLVGEGEFGFGATLALRREGLDDIGGFRRLHDQVADDYWLARLISATGRKGVLSDVVVTTDVSESGPGPLWDREVRWMRTMRSLRPASFVVLFLSFTFPACLAGLAMSAFSPAACGFAGLGLAMRGLLHCFQRHEGCDRHVGQDLLALPLRDTLLLVEWMAALAGTDVRWRGRRIVQRSEVPTASEVQLP